MLATEIDVESLLSGQIKEQKSFRGKFLKNRARMIQYLYANHPDDFRRTQERITEYIDGNTDSLKCMGFSVEQFIETFRQCFDETGHQERLAELETEHDRLMNAWTDLPTKRAKEKARKQLEELEAEMERIEEQQINLADTTVAQWEHFRELSEGIQTARKTFQEDSTESQQRRLGEALRSVIDRIELAFVSTGQNGSGWGKANSRLASITIYPLSGETWFSPVDSKGTLQYDKAHSFM
jgi:hypothetical protein